MKKAFQQNYSKVLMLFIGVFLSTQVGAQCKWTIEVAPDSYGDEISWELRSGGTAILSGGGVNYTETKTTTSSYSGPLEFYIETNGTYNDNSASYSVSNGSSVEASGDIVGGTDQTESNLNCSSGGGPGGGSGCDWTVRVHYSSWGDATTWTLKDNGGQTLLSGGTYSGSGGYDDTQTTTAEGPLTFEIDAYSSWMDNAPNVEISNENGMIVDEQIALGGSGSFTVNCDDEPSPGGGSCDAVIATASTTSPCAGSYFSLNSSSSDNSYSYKWYTDYGTPITVHHLNLK